MLTQPFISIYTRVWLKQEETYTKVEAFYNARMIKANSGTKPSL